MKIALIDTESSGLDHTKDRLIEVAVLLCNDHDGCLIVEDRYESLHDPGVPIPAEATAIHGITDAMVRGKRVDQGHLDGLLFKADLIVAFNSVFDRGFLPQVSHQSEQKPWTCAYTRIDWKQWGFRRADLRYLALEHTVAWGLETHRAMGDCAMLQRLLQCTPINSLLKPMTGPRYLDQMLANAQRPRILFRARKRGLDGNDRLRERGYQWGPPNKCWWKVTYANEQDDERLWLQDILFTGMLSGDWDATEVDDLDPKFPYEFGLKERKNGS